MTGVQTCALPISFGYSNLNTSANWTNAFNGNGTTVPWSIPGGAFSATCTTGTYTPDTLDLAFDLMPLLSAPVEAARAATNGLLMRIDPAWTNFAQKTFARYNIDRDTAELVLRDRPAAFSLLQSDAPDRTERIDNALSFVLDAGAETRIAVRFGEAVFTQDPRRIGEVRFFLASSNPIPAGCELCLSPFSTPVRLGETTWNHASGQNLWDNPGGDILPLSVAARRSTGGTGYCFDLSPLLRDSEAAAALRANGGLLRLVRTAREASSTTTWSASSPELLGIPAELAIAGLSLGGVGVSLEVAGTDPAADYEVQGAASLESGWNTLAPLPRSGSVELPAGTNGAVFYRVRERR